jgi:general secretion pathway protein K
VATSTPQGRSRRDRGAALLIVIVSVALVTAVAVDLAYQSRVSLQIAGNGRDELRAQALARGAVSVARLVLHFQSQLDGAMSRGQAVLQQAQAVQQSLPPGAAAPGAATGGLPRVEIWRLVPVDSTLVANLFGGAATPTRAGPANEAPMAGQEPRRAFGDFQGSFSAAIDDEDRKVNAQLDGLAQGGKLGAQLASFQALVADTKWDFLFDHDDDQGQRWSRNDVAAHLHDWVDDDALQSAVTTNYDRPFENGFGDENFVYDRGPDRYKAKNARFDSLEELHLVAGCSETFLAAFGDRLTVYLSRNSKMNVNADDPAELLRNARIMAYPPVQAIFSDPALPERLQKAVRLVRMGGFLSMTPQQFAGVLQSLGIGVQSIYTQASNTDVNGAFTDRSSVFHVRGQGSVGAVTKTIDTVVSFDPDQAREDATELGRPLHWREE